MNNKQLWFIQFSFIVLMKEALVQALVSPPHLLPRLKGQLYLGQSQSSVMRSLKTSLMGHSSRKGSVSWFCSFTNACEEERRAETQIVITLRLKERQKKMLPVSSRCLDPPASCTGQEPCVHDNHPPEKTPELIEASFRCA